MLRRPGRPVGPAIGLAMLLAGCGAGTPPVPAACVTTGALLERALAAAPGPARLADGTAISTCVARARSAADLVTLGSLLASTADRLAARATTQPAAALELGYLVGAVRRGAIRTNGVASQLADRIDSAAALRSAGPAPLAALHRGILAGRAGG